jgi:hypothetical protein
VGVRREYPDRRAFAVEDTMSDERQLLESARIEWHRDWDALLIGFVLGVLTTLAVL